MRSFIKSCLAAAVVAASLFSPASAVEELAAPTNGVPDGAYEVPVAADGEPISPYDVVPHDLDPAAGGYAEPTFEPHHSVYSPAPHAYDAGHSYDPGHLHGPGHLHASAHRHAAAPCCTPPKIRYWNHPLLGHDVCPCDCDETIETYIPVPSQCCPVAVKVCVPVCCVGAPQCDAGHDLLGRKTYEFCWPCGYRIKVVDRHTGTLVVHTFDR